MTSTIEKRDAIEMFYGSPLSAISDCLRSFIIPEDGHDLIACDFSNIEGRVLAWLSGHESKLESYRKNIDLYKITAAEIYGLSSVDQVTKPQRLVGKVAELALGYQGGRGAFLNMAKIYGLKVTEHEADTIKKNWRAANQQIVKYWYDLERTAMAALFQPGTTQSLATKYAKVQYRVAGSFLWCCLPSKRVIAYPYPEIKSVSTPWGQAKDALTYLGENSLTKSWERQTAYGGLLAENVTQAVARDLLANGMIKLTARNYDITMHVHDEIVSEVLEGFGSVEEMISIMTDIPDWANGLPVAAEGYRAKRYRK